MTIAQNIIQIVSQELVAFTPMPPVKRIHFKAGKMHAIIPESLSFCFDIIKKDTPALQETELLISELPLIVQCRKCGAQTALDEPLFICPQCGDLNLEIISGKDMFIDTIEIAEPGTLTPEESL